MSILVIWTSPNADGLTARAKNNIVKGITQAGGRAEELQLNRCSILRCLTCRDGWGPCRSEGRCILADDFKKVYEKMVAADGIVFVTPVYWHDLAECLKTFLDRLRRCEASHNHLLAGKDCLLVACAGGTGRGAVECLSRLEDTLGHMQMTAADRLPVIRFNQDYLLPALEDAGGAFLRFIDIKKQP